MQSTWEQNNWLYNNPLQRQAIAFVISVIIVVLLLLIPISLNYKLSNQEKVIEVTLSNPIEPIKLEEVNQSQENEPVVEKPMIKPVMKPTVQKKPNLPIEKAIDKSHTQTIPEIVQKPINPKVEEQTKSLPSSGTIFNSAYGKVKLYDLDDDFKARTGHEGDFKFPEIKQPEWNKVTKLIDEDLDKPRVMMNFYSEGIVGATEKFFDKISYKKVFTTRYGTKIACGGVGPLVMCSWK